MKDLLSKEIAALMFTLDLRDVTDIAEAVCDQLVDKAVYKDLMIAVLDTVDWNYILRVYQEEIE